MNLQPTPRRSRQSRFHFRRCVRFTKTTVKAAQNPAALRNLV
jgi:hypothetical protein